MLINTDNIVSMTEANQNFSRVARMVDEKGSVVIMKNNSPKYILVDFEEVTKEAQDSNDTIDMVTSRFIQHKKEERK